MHSEYLENLQLGTASGRRGRGFSVRNLFTECLLLLPWGYLSAVNVYHQISNIRRTEYPTLKRLSYCLAAFFVEYPEARCQVENEDVVGAAPTGDAPTTSEWSTIVLPTKVRLILEVLWYISKNEQNTPMTAVNAKRIKNLIALEEFLCTTMKLTHGLTPCNSIFSMKLTKAIYTIFICGSFFLRFSMIYSKLVVRCNIKRHMTTIKTLSYIYFITVHVVWSRVQCYIWQEKDPSW